MISITNEFANSGSWHLGIFLCQVHRHLSSHHILTLTTLTVDGSSGHIVMRTNLLHDVIDSQRFVIHLDGSLDDTLCQSDVNITIIHDAIS